MSTVSIPMVSKARSLQALLPAFLLSPALICVFLLILLPLGCLGIYSFWSLGQDGLLSTEFTLSSWIYFFSDPFYVGILLDTFRMSFTTMLISAVIGYGPAYYLASMPPQARGMMIVLLFLPSWISYVVRTMSWLPLLGKNGLLNGLLIDIGLINAPLPMLYTPVAVYLGIVHFQLPLMILNTYIGLQSVDANVISAARTLGANARQAFLTVTFPLAFPGLAAGCVLCFILSLGAFITPLILGGPGTIYYSNLVYETILHQLDWPVGATLSLVLIALLILLLYIYSRLLGFSTILRAMKS